MKSLTGIFVATFLVLGSLAAVHIGRTVIDRTNYGVICGPQWVSQHNIVCNPEIGTFYTYITHEHGHTRIIEIQDVFRRVESDRNDLLAVMPVARLVVRDVMMEETVRLLEESTLTREHARQEANVDMSSSRLTQAVLNKHSEGTIDSEVMEAAMHMLDALSSYTLLLDTVTEGTRR